MPATPADLDPTHFNIALLILGGLIYSYGLLSRFVKERLYLSAPILSVLLGVIVGPLVLNIFNVKTWGTQHIIVEEIARLAISIQLISTALRLRSAYPFRRLKSLAILLGPLMLAMWFVSSALVYWILDIRHLRKTFIWFPSSRKNLTPLPPFPTREGGKLSLSPCRREVWREVFFLTGDV